MDPGMPQPTAPHPGPPPPDAQPLAGRLARGAGVLAVYTAVIAIYASSIAGRLSTQFIGDGGDNWVFAWNAWWMKHCLVHGLNPYYCPMQFAPLGVPLTSHCLMPLPTLVMVGLWALLPMPLAYNLLVLAFLPLAGLCAYGLARSVTRDTLGGLAGGMLYMLCPFLTSKTLGHLNLLGAAFLPLYVLCLLRALDRPGRARSFALLGAFLCIVFSNEHTLIFAANITLWLWIWRGLATRDWRRELGQFWRVLRPVIVFSAGWAGFLAWYAVRYRAWPYRTGALAYCPEPLNYILPLFPTSIWRDAVVPPGQLGWDLSTLEMSVYLGWAALPMALIGFRAGRTNPLMRFMRAIFLAALVLSLGQKLQWHRQIVHLAGLPVYLPMGIYRYVPVLGSVGQSGRYMIIGYMAMAVGLAGLIAAARARYGPAAARGAVLAAMVLLGIDFGCRFCTVPIPRCPIPPGPGRVMDVRADPSLALYFQTLHERPLVGGYISRWPDGVFDAYRANAGIGWFFMRHKKRGAPPSPQEVRHGLADWDIRYVCAAPDTAEHRLLAAAGLPVIHEEDGTVTFSVPQAATSGPPVQARP
jgi:hypothetical protein